jgi:3-methyladenine DNA glycosylase AlkD
MTGSAEPASERAGASGVHVSAVLEELRRTADPTRLDGMARYGIATSRAIGVTVTELRAIARRLGRDHRLATGLWRSGVHEARILASMVEVPSAVTRAQMDRWVRGFDSWDLCDQVCGNLFDRTPMWRETAVAWSAREPEFERRAAFALMACAAVHREDEPDERFASLLPIVRHAATDDRTYVKKAVSWALRQIGKRSAELRTRAIVTAEEIARIDSRTARWIASDALRELTGIRAAKRQAARQVPL